METNNIGPIAELQQPAARRGRRPNPVIDGQPPVKWFKMEDLKKIKIEENPLNISVYFRLDPKSKTRHGRVTLSKFLTNKYKTVKKLNFGAMDGKIVIQFNQNDGFVLKPCSSKYTRLQISNCNIANVIFDKYGISESNKSSYFKLKDLGNDFYLLDEIIK